MSNMIGKITSKAMGALSALHGNKTLAELATDYEVHPKSMLYRLCDWIGENTGTIILTPYLETVGNCAEDVYFGLLKARREGKKMFALWPYELPWLLKFRLTNVEVVSVESEYRAVSPDSLLCIVGRVLITAYFAFFRTLSLARRLFFGVHLNNVYRVPTIGGNTLWQPDWVPGFSWDIVNSYGWQKQLEAPLEIFIGAKKRALAELRRKQMGLPDDVWFVCLHVRESGFHKDTHLERNASIFNYIGAIEEVTSRGGWVVRMGDASMTKLPAMERVIDYPFTEAKSALMDVYLISQSRLYIGMPSGIMDVAILFQRPMIMTNMANWLHPLPILKGSLAVLKHIYSKSKGRYLTIPEWLDESWTAVSYLGMGDDYVLCENTPDELRDVVQEFFARGDEWEPTPLQRLFNEARSRRGREIISEQIFFAGNTQPCFRKNIADYDLFQRYRLAARLDSSLGTLGAKFLQQNWDF